MRISITDDDGTLRDWFTIDIEAIAEAAAEVKPGRLRAARPVMIAAEGAKSRIYDEIVSSVVERFKKNGDPR